VSEEERKAYGIELLLQEPEVVSWLSDYVPSEADEPEDDEPLQAA
jgi:hypothetical protein